jgi:cytochrome P450
MRDEAPLYYNAKYDFYALTRWADVEPALVDWDSYRSGKGSVLELIRANIEIPPGIILFEDPPVHDVHRGLLSRVFTPKKMNAIEPKVREFCARTLDPLRGAEGFDFIADLGAPMPMRTIGYLLGIPETDQEAIRDRLDDGLRLNEDGTPREQKLDTSGDMFAEYIDWRAEHPSDDLMTQLLNAEFQDEAGETRRLTRDEVLTYTAVIAGAGNETTGRLIGWLAKLLAEHPDQRRAVVEDRSLLDNVIDETLRFEPTGHAIARYVTEDVEYHGTTVPAGSPILLLMAAANRDPRRYDHPDVFDIHREDIQHLTFGYGLHYCLGANLARLEGRVALDELLNRFPEWDIDQDGMELAPTSTVRGWARMPLVLP